MNYPPMTHDDKVEAIYLKFHATRDRLVPIDPEYPIAESYGPIDTTGTCSDCWAMIYYHSHDTRCPICDADACEYCLVDHIRDVHGVMLEGTK